MPDHCHHSDHRSCCWATALWLGTETSGTPCWELRDLDSGPGDGDVGCGTRHWEQPWVYWDGKGGLQRKVLQFLPWMPASKGQHCQSCCKVTRGVRRWSKKSWWWGTWGKKAFTVIQQTQLNSSWNKQFHSPRHHLCGLLPLLGKTWPKKKKNKTNKPATQTKFSSKQCTSRAHRQTGPLLPGSSWRGQGAKPLCCPSQTGCVLDTGAQGGEASCDLWTCAQLSTAPACTDNSNTAFSLLGAASKHHPDHPPLSNPWSCPVAQQARIQETRKHFSEWMLDYNFLCWELDRNHQFQSFVLVKTDNFSQRNKF